MAILANTVVAAALALVVVSCGGDDDAEPSTTGSSPATVASSVPATRGPDTIAVASTSPPTPPPGTAAAASTSAVPAPTAASATTVEPSTEACPAITGTDQVNDGFPMRMSSLVGADIRTGAHRCFERIVLELGGQGELPGYLVGYERDPIRLSPSDQTVDIAGDATLVLRAAAWMTTMEGGGYQGPTQFAPTNVEHVLELRLIENFEGMSAWAIGLDHERAFAVTTLTGPTRIVIDVAG